MYFIDTSCAPIVWQSKYKSGVSPFETSFFFSCCAAVYGNAVTELEPGNISNNLWFRGRWEAALSKIIHRQNLTESFHSTQRGKKQMVRDTIKIIRMADASGTSQFCISYVLFSYGRKAVAAFPVKSFVFLAYSRIATQTQWTSKIVENAL